MGRRAPKKENTMTTGMTTLGEVLGNDSRFNAGHFLYLPMNEVWQLGTKCAVLAESDVDGVPDLAQQNGLSYALGIAAVHDIVANAREQIKNVSLDQLLQAFLFYYDHDAFIAFDD
jgi:hypothetical protein